jgi:hypothetical protein
LTEASEREANMTETQAHISAVSVPKVSPAMGREIRATKRDLRRRKRGLTGAAYERRRVALKGLTELECDPMRPGLAVTVAVAVRRAI